VLNGLRSQATRSDYERVDAWQPFLATFVASCNAFYLDLRPTPFLIKMI